MNCVRITLSIYINNNEIINMSTVKIDNIYI